VTDRRGTYSGATPLKADQREITCAAAKVTNQHQRVRFKALRIIIGSADRFVRVSRVANTDPPVSLSIAMAGERLVRHGTGEGNRPARDDAAAKIGELAIRVADQEAKKCRQQIFEFVTAAKDASFIEDGACNVTLKRLNEARFVGGS